MSSGGGKTQTSTSDVAAWAKPYYKQGLDVASNLVNQPYQGYEGQLVAGLTPDQQLATNMIRNQLARTGVLDAGTGYLTDILGGAGKYSGGSNPFLGATTSVAGSVNPFAKGLSTGGAAFNASTTVGKNPYAGPNQYLEDMVASSLRGVTDNFSKATMPSLLSQFQQGGAFGGTAMQNQMDAAANTLAQNLGEVESGIRFNDYNQRAQLAEAGLNRELSAQQGDNQINAQMANAAADRKLQGGIAAANIWDRGQDRTLQAQLADLSRNSGLAENALSRDLQAWGQYQGNQLGALGQVPGFNQAGYYGANQLANQGLLQQSTNQAGLDADYNQYLDERGYQGNQLGLLAQMLGTIQGTGTQTSPNPNYRSAGQNILGGALGVGGLLSSMGWKPFG